MAHKRKNVVWKDPGARIATRRPHPHIAEVTLKAENKERWEQHLVVGTLWHVTAALCPLATVDPGSYEQHEIPYLSMDFGYYNQTASRLSPGTAAVYLGTVRVTEYSHGRALSLPRHVFLIGGQRWMVADLNLLAPVSTGV